MRVIVCIVIAAVIIAWCFIPPIGMAQPPTNVKQDTSLTVDGMIDLLSVPTSPAFTVLGNEPMAIERPTTISDFSVIARQVIGSESGLPIEAGVEFNPYLLLRGKKALSIGEIRQPEWYKTLSLSFGSISDTLGSDDFASTLVGFGLKLSPISGKYQDTQIRKLEADLTESLSIYREYLSQWDGQDQLQELIGQMETELKSENPNQPIINELIQEYDLIRRALIDYLTLVEQVPDDQVDNVATLIEEMSADEEAAMFGYAMREDVAALRAIAERIQDTKLKRMGFTVDLAAGLSWSFSKGDADSAEFHAGGAWITSGYEGAGSLFGIDVSLLCLARYLHDRSAGIYDQNNLDLGGRLIMETVSPFSLSLEGVFRFWSREFDDAIAPAKDNIDGDAWRAVGSASYQFGTSKAVTFSFGRSFDDPQGRDLIASISLSFMFNDSEGIELTPDIFR
jgi:hypothetical protein